MFTGCVAGEGCGQKKGPVILVTGPVGKSTRCQLQRLRLVSLSSVSAALTSGRHVAPAGTGCGCFRQWPQAPEGRLRDSC